MKSKIFRFLAVGFLLLSSLISGPVALASPQPGNTTLAITAAEVAQSKQKAREEQTQNPGAKLELPTGGELGREDVREAIESADTPSSKKKRDDALKITRQKPGGEYSANSVEAR